MKLTPCSLLKLIRFDFARAVAVLLVFSAGYMAGYLSSPFTSHQFNHQSQFHTNCTLISHISTPPTQQPESEPPPHDLLRFKTSCANPVPNSEIHNTIISKLFDGFEPYNNFPSKEVLSLIHEPKGNPRGWGSRGAVFRELIESVRPDVIMELGAFLGASALHMAGVTCNISLSSSLILCVDDFRGWPGFRTRFPNDVPPNNHGDSLLLEQFMANIKANNESNRIIPIPFSTSSAMLAFCDWGIYGDLIEVDAGHDFQSAWSDINRAYAVLRPGGVLFGHDYFTRADNNGVRRAVNLFAKVKKLQVRPNGQHWVQCRPI